MCCLLFLPPQVATVWAAPRQEVERRRRLCCPSYRNCQRSRTASSAWCSPPPGQCSARANSALTSMALIARGWTDRLFTGWLFLLRNVHAIFYQIMKVMRQVRSSVIQHKSAVAFIINTKKLLFLVFKLFYFQLTMHAVCGMSSRELAYQIAEQFRVLGKPLGLRDCIIVGGMGKNGLSCDSN